MMGHAKKARPVEGPRALAAGAPWLARGRVVGPPRGEARGRVVGEARGEVESLARGEAWVGGSPVADADVRTGPAARARHPPPAPLPPRPLSPRPPAPPAPE